MSETARFSLRLAAWTGIFAAAILALPSRRAAGDTARGFFWLCAISAAAVLLERIGIAAGVTGRIREVENGYAWIRWIVVGVAAASALLSLGSPPEASAAFVRSPKALSAICAFASLGYFAIEAGKLAHDAEMRAFFTASGYPVATTYAVMAAEALGAVGLLVPRARLAAAAGLSLLMLGAIGTHLKNGDPFSDSLDAVRFLVLLGAIAALARPPRLPARAGRSPTSSRPS